MKELNKLNIAYWPNSYTEDKPGDRRRFYYYADKKNISFELYNPSKSYEIIILSQKSDLSLTKAMKRTGAKVIYDCNNSYHNCKSSFKDRLRGLAKFLAREYKYPIINYNKALKKTLSEVDGVICCSEEQATQLKEYNINVHCIPGIAYNEVINVKKSYSRNNIINIVWEGLPTNTVHLNTLKTVFEKFSESNNFILHVITDPYFYQHLNKFSKIRTKDVINNVCENIRFHEWSSETYSKLITECDVAIIPIDSKFQLALGKPEEKLIYFWKMGMPTITASTKSYDRVMKDAGIELTCKNNDDWLEHLVRLASNNKIREDIGNKAKYYAEKKYSEDIILNKWDSLFQSIL